jgi:hypothetical protein
MRTLARVAKAVVVVAASLALVRFVAVDSVSHSASDTLRPWAIQVAVIGVFATILWIAIDRLDRARYGRDVR